MVIPYGLLTFRRDEEIQGSDRKIASQWLTVIKSIALGIAREVQENKDNFIEEKDSEDGKMNRIVSV